MTMRRIGIFGGTFNPIHEGHLHLIAGFYQQLGLSEVILIPDYTPPHKVANDLADGEDRYNLCRIATHGIPYIRVSDYELRRQTKSYTVYTLEHFADLYPDDELCLLMGSDMFFTMETWHQAQRIFELATLCAGARNAGEYEKLLSHAQELRKKGARAEVISLDALSVSSTEIRESIKAGNHAPQGLPDAVQKYIETVCLYTEERPEVLRYKSLLADMLSPKRYYHSLCVAREATALAVIFGADAQKAYTAGLLHDIAKDMSTEQQLQMLAKFDIILSDAEERSKQLWHPIVGAVYVQHELSINDSEIINAIRYHTTARKGITLLEMIIYLADCISFDRDYPDAAILREKITHSLQDAMLSALSLTIQSLAKRDSLIHIDTIEAYNDLC
ncbi:nicotinate-nucleotide adenylyltransferase [Acetanaerobacterium elongatum]|uniref:Probable nicotinate-nucleotide adenylyltransferase n=2 Tax=Acetanaerobacterium elongatum TaxID=258515 RepID=A0A1H0DMC5_9FIRM|nr:nicotinate-nucleotide adenylyltransferase [Acetanaerobacterium elongatum]